MVKLVFLHRCVFKNHICDSYLGFGKDNLSASVQQQSSSLPAGTEVSLNVIVNEGTRFNTSFCFWAEFVVMITNIILSPFSISTDTVTGTYSLELVSTYLTYIFLIDTGKRLVNLRRNWLANRQPIKCVPADSQKVFFHTLAAEKSWVN